MDIIRATNVKDILLAATERMSDYDIQDNPFTYDSKKSLTFFTHHKPNYKICFEIIET